MNIPSFINEIKNGNKFFKKSLNTTKNRLYYRGIFKIIL